MKVTFAHLCDYASVSREGKLSAMGIFDRIGVAALPTVHPLFYLAYEIEMRPAEIGQPFKIKIIVVDADGRKMLQTEGEATVQAITPSGESLKIPQLVAFGAMPLPRDGKYSIDIFLNGDHKGGAAFTVAVGPEPEPDPGGLGLQR